MTSDGPQDGTTIRATAQTPEKAVGEYTPYELLVRDYEAIDELVDEGILTVQLADTAKGWLFQVRDIVEASGGDSGSYTVLSRELASTFKIIAGFAIVKAHPEWTGLDDVPKGFAAISVVAKWDRALREAVAEASLNQLIAAAGVEE